MAQNNTTSRAGRQNVRSFPAWRINSMLRRAGLDHFTIAQRASVSESQVSHTIRRRRRDTEACERVWAVLERILA